MSPADPLILHVQIPGAEPYQIGDEICQQSHAEAIEAEAIEAEAEAIAANAGADLLKDPPTATRDQLRAQVVAEMTPALTDPGDSYRAPDGVRYTLTRFSDIGSPTDQTELL